MSEQNPASDNRTPERIELVESDLRDVPVSDIAHPLADRVGSAEVGGDWVATETRSAVVHLSPIRLNFLSTAVRDGRRPVLISDELTRLTPSFNRVWRLAGGAWVVRESTGGLRNGYDGRRLDDLSDAWTLPTPTEVDEIAVNYLRPVPPDTLQLGAMLALRHPARTSTVLGAAVEDLSRSVLGRPPRIWGPHEPTDSPWDRSALTALIREHMPEEKAVFASGPGLAASVSAQRTEHGVEEIVYATLGVGTPDPDRLNRIRLEASGVLQRLAESAMPLVGVLLARPGTADLLVPPYLTAPPIPLALLIGAPAVRSFGLSVDRLAESFGARPVGRPRIPALLFDLGALEPQAWQRLDAILSSLDQQKLAEAFGRGTDGLRGVQIDRPDPVERPDPGESGAHMPNRDLILLETVKTHRARLSSAFVFGALEERRLTNDNVRRLIGSIVLAAVVCAGCVGFSFVSSLLGKQAEAQRVQAAQGPATGDISASDTFDRQTATGWGSAQRGGRWTMSGPAGAYQVSDGQGRIQLTGSASRGGYLSGVLTDRTDLQLTMVRTVNGRTTAATGGTVTASVLGRRISSTQDYRLVTRLQADGSVALSLLRVAEPSQSSSTGTEQLSPTVILFGGQEQPTEAVPLSVRLQVIGTNPTTLRAKVWQASSGEPESWTLTATDTTSDLQRPGSIGLTAVAGGSANSGAGLAVNDLIGRVAP